MKLATRFKRLRRPPGSVLYDVAEFLFSKKTLEHVVQPIISDFQKDYFTALAEGRKCKAKWIRIRDTIGLLKALGLLSLVNVIKEIFRLAK